MDGEFLPPEARIDLQIRLDRLLRTARECRKGLFELGEVRLTKRAYLELLSRQRDAQAEWERRHRDLFVELGGERTTLRSDAC
jgi:hypothetical protein